MILPRLVPCLLAAFYSSQAEVYIVTTRLDSGPGSLRQAITDANASPGLDTISFNISGTGVQTIGFSTLLPDITDPVIIDGATQPGYAGSPLIEVAGTSSSRSISTFKLAAGGSTIRGLILQKISSSPPSDAIIITGPGGNKVEGCWLGVTPDGAGKGSIHGAAVHIIDSANNMIGGTDPAQRNIISGASTAGVMMT